MSFTYLNEQYQAIKDADPMISVVALRIAKCLKAGDEAGADERTQKFAENYGKEKTDALTLCVLYHTLYTVS